MKKKSAEPKPTLTEPTHRTVRAMASDLDGPTFYLVAHETPEIWLTDDGTEMVFEVQNRIASKDVKLYRHGKLLEAASQALHVFENGRSFRLPIKSGLYMALLSGSVTVSYITTENPTNLPAPVKDPAKEYEEVFAKLRLKILAEHDV